MHTSLSQTMNKSLALATLKNVIAHYNSENRAVRNFNCLYFTTKGGPRCAIGMLVSEEEAEDFASKYESISVRGIIERLLAKNLPVPAPLLQFDTSFLYDLQRLHDCPDFWDKNGISEKGREWADYIISFYKLNS